MHAVDFPIISDNVERMYHGEKMGTYKSYDDHLIINRFSSLLFFPVLFDFYYDKYGLDPIAKGLKILFLS